MNNKLINLSYINNPKDYSKDYYTLYNKYKMKYLSLKDNSLQKGGAGKKNRQKL